MRAHAGGEAFARCFLDFANLLCSDTTHVNQYCKHLQAFFFNFFSTSSRLMQSSAATVTARGL